MSSIALSLRMYDLRCGHRANAVAAPAPRVYRVRKPRVIRSWNPLGFAVALAALAVVYVGMGQAHAQGRCDVLGPRLDGTVVTVCGGAVARVWAPSRVVQVFVDEIDGDVARIEWPHGDGFEVDTVATASLPSWAREGMRVMLADGVTLRGKAVR